MIGVMKSSQVSDEKVDEAMKNNWVGLFEGLDFSGDK